MCKCKIRLIGELTKQGFKNPKLELVTFTEAGEFIDVPGVSLFYTRNRKEFRTIIAAQYCPWCGEKYLKENLPDNKENFTFGENEQNL